MPHLAAVHFSRFEWDVVVVDSIDVLTRKQSNKTLDAFGRAIPKFSKARVIQDAVNSDSLRSTEWYERKLERAGRQAMFSTLANTLPITTLENLK